VKLVKLDTLQFCDLVPSTPRYLFSPSTPVSKGQHPLQLTRAVTHQKHKLTGSC